MIASASTNQSSAAQAPNVVLLDGSQPGDREVLGGKAYSVNRMQALGLPVPLAFALPTHVCGLFHESNRALPESVWDEVRASITALEADTGRTFGAGPSPLLVSVRSGAAQSMPGMMDTVLNLGLTPELVQALATESGDSEWADDTWARFRRSYAGIVLGDPEAEPPADPWEQLRAAIGAVFESWTNERVHAYRERHNLDAGGGTAVTVQAMIFGNRDSSSGTGVMFSRNPNTGAPELFGEWLANAQGEDVVSGEATPTPLHELAESEPELHAALVQVAEGLEREYRDLVDVEFTVESGRLYVLQCRAGKRSAKAAVRIAADLAASNLITGEEALGRVTADHVETLRSSTSITGDRDALAQGLGASPGVAHGHVASTFDEVSALTAEGKDVILVSTFTAPDDVPAMFASVGVLTEVGGATSHAALVCREIGLPCVVGAGPGLVDQLQGKTITIDGESGKVYAEGDIDTSAAGGDEQTATLICFADALGLADHPIHLLASNAKEDRGDQ